MEHNTGQILRTLASHNEVGSVEAHPSGGGTVYRVCASGALKAPAISLFYFSDQDNLHFEEPYRLCLEGAVRADKLGLDALWTPERHFTGVGAASPNPAVLGAALAMITRRIKIRAGSVVLPLHHPVRVAEEWAMVDRLSGGRVGLSFAPGWVINDFVLAPDRYSDRRQLLAEYLLQVKDLWAGMPVTYPNGQGAPTSIAIRPRPLQANLPIWLTAVNTPATFELAGKLGVNILTALLELSVEQLAENLTRYRAARAAAGHDPAAGAVTVMVHTYVAASEVDAEREARPALRQYFAAQSALRHAVARQAGLKVGDKSHVTDRMLDFAVERFVRERSLIGSFQSVQRLVQSLVEIGCTEVACLIDFGVDGKLTLNGIDRLADVRNGPFRRLEGRLNELIGRSGAHEVQVMDRAADAPATREAS